MGLPSQTDQASLKSALNITATQVISQTGGFIYTAVATGAAMSVYDGTTAADVSAANLIATIQEPARS